MISEEFTFPLNDLEHCSRYHGNALQSEVVVSRQKDRAIKLCEALMLVPEKIQFREYKIIVLPQEQRSVQYTATGFQGYQPLVN